MINILIVAGAALAGALGFAATKPNTFRIQRSATIRARPETVAALLEDFHRWSEWSPWEKLDPAMKRTVSGTQRGPGAVYEWDGNRKAGAGRMEIVESTPSKVVLKLDFIRPFRSSNMTEFQLQPEGDSTRLTWVMTGPNLFMSKVMSLFISLDKMVGKDFEAGLANLKTLAER